MTYLFNEIARQQEVVSSRLLKQRKASRIALLALTYTLVAVAGVIAAAIAAENARSGVAFAASALAAPFLLAGLLHFRSRIQRINKSLDQSLDVLAATRAMAIEADIPAMEQEQLQSLFHDLQDRRMRDFFDRKRYLI